MGKLNHADPRNLLPSRAHPEHRSHRKDIEKEHPFDWTGPLVLGMLGIGLAWDIEKQVKKREERKEKEDQPQRQSKSRGRGGEDQQRRRHRSSRPERQHPQQEDRDGGENRSRSSHAGTGKSDRGSDRGSVAKDTVDLERGRRRRSRADRGRSVDVGRRNEEEGGEDPRYIEDDSYYEQSRYDRGPYDDGQKYQDREYQYHGGRSRRDSW